jgi:hypothetical protein
VEVVERRRRVGAALARNRRLAAFVTVVALGFGGFGVVTGSDLAIPYAVIVLSGAMLVAAVEPEEGFGPLVLAGLVLWAVGHLAGGTVGIGGDRTLYNAITPGGLHFDNVVHFVGFGTAGLAWWEATRSWLPSASGHALGAACAVWLAGMGIGALNEMIEFLTTLVLPETNVGGFHNTGRDLIANCLGAAVAGGIAARRTRAEPRRPSTFSPERGP